MRRTRPFGLWLVTLLVPMLAATPIANAGDEEADDGLDVFFRDVDLSAASAQELESYPDASAGESEVIERAFPGAPPQISHTVEDMLPITADDNECLECHHPDNAVSKEDYPLPESHFERPVMAKGGKKESMVWVVKGYEKADDVVGARYSCGMCHAPQANNVKTPRSSFVRVKVKDEASK